MQKFTVPQIEYETKIVGPFTFKQFIFIGAAGVIAFILYFVVSFPIFLILSFILGIISFALAFLKIGGMSLPSLILKSLQFNIGSKTYLWQKKETPIVLVETKRIEKEEKEELPLKIAGNSQLKKMRNQLETKS